KLLLSDLSGESKVRESLKDGLLAGRAAKPSFFSSKPFRAVMGTLCAGVALFCLFDRYTMVPNHGEGSLDSLEEIRAKRMNALTSSLTAGYKGVGARGSDSGAGGGFEALKKSSGQSGDSFNRTGGGAAGALDSAAKSAIGGGDSFGGAGGGG